MKRNTYQRKKSVNKEFSIDDISEDLLRELYDYKTEWSLDEKTKSFKLSVTLFPKDLNKLQNDIFDIIKNQLTP